MNRTPEGTYFAANVALYHASRERENAITQAGQEEGLHSSELWFQGFVFSEIQKQLANLTSVLEQEIPPIDYHIRRGSERAGVDNLEDTISKYNNQPTIDPLQLYVALRVTEEYVRERTATSEAINALEKDVRKTTKNEYPKFKPDTYLLKQGVIYLREKVESTLTQEELENTTIALE